MDRRAFLAALAAGAVVTAGGLWIPGQKLISIPNVATPWGGYIADLRYFEELYVMPAVRALAAAIDDDVFLSIAMRA